MLRDYEHDENVALSLVFRACLLACLLGCLLVCLLACGYMACLHAYLLLAVLSLRSCLATARGTGTNLQHVTEIKIPKTYRHRVSPWQSCLPLTALLTA